MNWQVGDLGTTVNCRTWNGCIVEIVRIPGRFSDCAIHCIERTHPRPNSHIWSIPFKCLKPLPGGDLNKKVTWDEVGWHPKEPVEVVV